MVQGQPQGVIAAAVMTDDGEPVVTQCPHRGKQVPGAGPFGVRGVVESCCGLAGAAVPGQIRAHHGPAEGDQLGSDPMPGRRRPWATVDK